MGRKRKRTPGESKRQNLKKELEKLSLDRYTAEIRKYYEIYDKEGKTTAKTQLEVIHLIAKATKRGEEITIEEIANELNATRETLESQRRYQRIVNVIYKLYKREFLQRKPLLIGKFRYTYTINKEKVKDLNNIITISDLSKPYQEIYDLIHAELT